MGDWGEEGEDGEGSGSEESRGQCLAVLSAEQDHRSALWSKCS